MITIAIHESKNSQKVIKTISAESQLTNYCSAKYAAKIFDAYQNGLLWGCYFTPSQKIRATFI